MKRQARKPGNTYASPTAMSMTLAVKVALNPNTTNKLSSVSKKDPIRIE